jgi:hypothetical protein
LSIIYFLALCRLTLFLQDGEACEAKGDPELFLGHGEELTKLRSKCCYFFRACGVGEPRDLDTGTDDGILFGTIEANALETFQTMLNVMYGPMLAAVKPWARADSEHVEGFSKELDKVGLNLKEALNSLISDWRLAKPDKEFDPDDRALVARATQDVEVVIHFEGKQRMRVSEEVTLTLYFLAACCVCVADVLESWCMGVEKNIKTEEDDGINSGTGPMTELDFWRQRMQRYSTAYTMHHTLYSYCAMLPQIQQHHGAAEE